MAPYPTQWADNDPNKFMCCLCFEIFDVSVCAVDKDGKKIDVCATCWVIENLLKEKK
jgi:hypothetical protein